MFVVVFYIVLFLNIVKLKLSNGLLNSLNLILTANMRVWDCFMNLFE